MRIQHLCHSTYQHQYHIVWGTRYRRHFLKPENVKKVLLATLRKSVEKYPTLTIDLMNTDLDHVHLQIEIPPNLSVAVVVKTLKAISSIELKKKFKFIREMYIDGSIWSVGYFSSTIGLNEKQIAKYIEWQGKHDLPQELDLGFS